MVLVVAFLVGDGGGGSPAGGSSPPSAGSTPGPLHTAVPAPAADVAAACAPVLAAMPVRLDGGQGAPTLAPLVVDPGGPTFLAWGEPLVTVQCGVSRPAALREGNPDLNPITLGANGAPQVGWIAEAAGGRVTWTTIDRAVYVQVVVPTGETGYVQTVSDVVARTLPDPVCLPGPTVGDPPDALYCYDRP